MSRSRGGSQSEGARLSLNSATQRAPAAKTIKDSTSQPPARGSTRPVGVAPSPKAAASTPTGARAGRRAGSDVGSRELGAPSSPRRSDDGEDVATPLADFQALSRLLQEASRPLVPSVLPQAPSALLHSRDKAEPIVVHLCKLWNEAGLGDKEWTQALRMFEAELYDQPRQKKDGEEPSDGRWTLETFSMWLLKRGRRLRECSQWFRAFDFDQDEMIGIADFLQGLVAAAAPRAASSGSAGGLCSALAIFRLLDLEKRASLDVRDLEGILSDAQVINASDSGLSLQQLAQRATVLESFKSSLFPYLSSAPAFRLRVFGSSSTDP